MTNSLKALGFFVLVASSVASSSFALTPFKEINCNKHVAYCYMGKITLEGDPFYYGTAILVKVTEHRYYFATNQHLLPHIDHWDNLRFHTSLNNYQPINFKVEGSDPGRDIALFSVRRKLPDGFSSGVFKELPEEVLTKTSINGHSFSLAMVGASGNPRQKIGAALNFGNVLLHEMFKLERSVGYFTEPHYFRRLDYCPAPLMRDCYRLPVFSQGFSGSPILIVTNSGKVEIAGMVSHFSPMLGYTYMIGISEVRDSVNSILALRTRQTAPVEVNEATDGLFRYKSKGVLEVTRGTLKQALVKVESVTPRGGDDSIGGGDDSIGGGDDSIGGGDDGIGGGDERHVVTGHDSIGGGGEKSGTVQRLEGGDGVIALDSKAFDLELSNPLAWPSKSSNLSKILSSIYSFKGTNEWLRFSPFIKIQDGDKTQKVFGTPEKTIATLGAFVAEYRLKESFEARLEPYRHTLPVQLKKVSSLPAVRAMARIDRLAEFTSREHELFRLIRNLNNMVGDPKDRLTAYLNDLQKVSASGVYENFFIRAPGLGIIYPVQEVTLANNKISIDTPDAGSVTLELLGEWVQEGDYFFRFRGRVKETGIERLWVRETSVGQLENPMATATLQWDSEEKAWELKIFLASNTKANNSSNKKTILLHHFAAWVK